MARLLVYVMLLTPVWGYDDSADAEECYPRCTGTGWTLSTSMTMSFPGLQVNSPRKSAKSFSPRF